MTKKRCPLGEACDLTVAWMAGAAKAQDQIKAQAAEIERLEAKLAKAVEALDYCINAPFSGWTIAQGYAHATLAEIKGENYD